MFPENAGATQKELARQLKYLKVENQILRSKLPKRSSETVKERNRLVKFAKKLGGNPGWIRAEKKPPPFFASTFEDSVGIRCRAASACPFR